MAHCISCIPRNYAPAHGWKGMQFDAVFVSTEILFTFAVILFCLLIFKKTQEMYQLSKHEGIGHFRNAFLYFGLAYAFSFLGHLMLLLRFGTGARMLMKTWGPILMVIVAYFSTIAILSLLYSTLWKNNTNYNFIMLSQLGAAIVAILAFITRSPEIVVMIQLLIFILIIAIQFFRFLKKKKRISLLILYTLLFLFWVLNRLSIRPMYFFPAPLVVMTHIISISIFAYIYLKVSKWTK